MLGYFRLPFPASSNGLALLFQSGQILSGLFEDTTPPEEGLTPVWRAEYIDIAGDQVRPTINNNGTTTLVVRQYANMTLDAIGTRSEAAGCDTDYGAAQLIGYAARYNDGPERTWANTGLSRNVDIGEPIFHHCWDTAGIFEVELFCRDADGRQSRVVVNVEVQALATPTDISAGGAWPTFVNFGVYGLARGGNYISRGELRTDNLVGVRIIATGSGADPMIAEFNPDSRGLTDTALTTRARDCVIVNLDYEDWRTGLIGASYCGSYGGHCNRTTLCTHPQRYIYEHDGIADNSANQANNIRYPRGCFVVDGGIVGSGSESDAYALIGGGRSFNFSGTSFRRTTGGDSGNPMRTYFDFTVMRNVQIWSTTSTIGWLKGSMFPCVYAATPSDPWPDDDSFGDFATSRALYLANGSNTNYVGNWGVGGRYFWVSDCLFGGPSQFGNPAFLGGWNPQNDDAPSTPTGPWQSEDCYEGGAIGGWERNRMTYNYASAITLTGLGLSGRDNRQLDGTLIVPETSSNENRISPGFDGPYYTADRPVVVLPSLDAIVPSAVAEYVDGSGVRQTTTIEDGVTTITGIAPFLLTIDATGMRAPEAYAAYAGSEAVYDPASYPDAPDPDARALEAFSLLACGHRINFGGGAGADSWSYPEGAGYSKNEDAGVPLWATVLTVVGTHTVRMRHKDTLGNEITTSFNVTVSAPPSATHILVSAGAWPTFASNMRYTLDAGGDYRSFGTVNTSDLHNVIFEKVGVGADPRIATWDVDARSKFGNVTMYPTRTRHVRMVNIDINFLSEGQRGYDYCGPIGGRVRLYVGGGQSNLYNEGTTAERSACRFSRGAFFVGAELNNIGSEDGYTIIGTWNRLVMMGCNINATDIGFSTWAVCRTYGTKHIYRHNKFRVTHAETSSCGLPLSMLCVNGLSEVEWPDTDIPAELGSALPNGYRADHSHVFNCQLLDATSSRTNGVFTTGGNPDGLSLVRPNLLGVEDCVWYPSGSIALAAENYQLQGRGAYMRNVRRNMGAGSYVGYVTQNPNSVANPGNTDVAWHGPYFHEEANSRPVPSSFSTVPEGLSPQLIAEYVDASGVLQSAIADKDTIPTITGVAPFPVFFDASGSRSVDPNADDLAGAYTRMNFRFNAGTGATGTWSITGAAKNQISGAPIAGFLFEIPGTHTFTLTNRDTEGRQGSITMTIVVTAPAAGTDISVGGSWPTFVSGGIYNLAAGTDHSGKGELVLSGLHNVLIRKVGVGADPIVTRVRWDTRHTVGTAVSRTRNCRIDGINAAVVEESPIGPLHCVVANHGGSFYYSRTSLQYWWEIDADTQTERDNMAYPRGSFFWNCSEINSSPEDNYVFIWSAKNTVFRNCVLDKNLGDAGSHVLRGGYDGLDLRHNLLRGSVAFMSYCKITGWDNGATFDAWPANDRYGNGATGVVYRPVSRLNVIENNIFGASGATVMSGFNVEVMPENDEIADPDQANELMSYQNNVYFSVSSSANGFGCRNILYGNNLLNMGAGGEGSYGTAQRYNRVPVSFQGPYLTNTRPAFVD